ncbi:MAG: response regulator transcription factor [Campylobacterota bacterium]|nr:response regulator transcription factor [Campylobacterota bacterium]
MKKLTLLCVEDDIEALEDIVYLLKRYFSKIYTATNGESALDIYNTNQPDIILLDVNIPKLNGLEVASRIRETDEKTPIIFLTAHSEKDKLLKAITLQVSSYIIKPFKIQELKDNIFNVIKKINVSNSKLQLLNNFIWDKETYELFYFDEQIDITKNEILLIKLLLANRSRFLTVNEILIEICDKKDEVTGTNNIVQLISRFKKKVRKQTNSEDFFIENIYGGGYRLR